MFCNLELVEKKSGLWSLIRSNQQKVRKCRPICDFEQLKSPNLRQVAKRLFCSQNHVSSCPFCDKSPNLATLFHAYLLKKLLEKWIEVVLLADQFSPAAYHNSGESFAANRMGICSELRRVVSIAFGTVAFCWCSAFTAIYRKAWCVSWMTLQSYISNLGLGLLHTSATKLLIKTNYSSITQ